MDSSIPVRGFRLAINCFDALLPQRQTSGSAGYDFFCRCDLTLPPRHTVKYRTGISAFMPHDEVLKIYIRSSVASNDIILRNSVAIIDSDFHDEIILLLYNDSDSTRIIKQGDRIAQGIFQKFLTTGDLVDSVRRGGIGSTNLDRQ